MTNGNRRESDCILYISWGELVRHLVSQCHSSETRESTLKTYLKMGLLSILYTGWTKEKHEYSQRDSQWPDWYSKHVHLKYKSGAWHTDYSDLAERIRFTGVTSCSIPGKGVEITSTCWDARNLYCPPTKRRRFRWWLDLVDLDHSSLH
jgi:hypothetical protein